MVVVTVQRKAVAGAGHVLAKLYSFLFLDVLSKCSYMPISQHESKMCTGAFSFQVLFCILFFSLIASLYTSKGSL